MGRNGIAQQPIIATLTLMARDINNKTFKLIFDLTDIDSSLIIGLDAQQHSIRTYCESRGEITFLPPRPCISYTLNVYIHHLDPLKLRAFVDIVGFKPTLNSLLVTKSSYDLRLFSLAKQGHRYTHAP